MKKIRISFTRLSTVTETGKADIEVNDPTDAEEIEKAISSNAFKAFIIDKREYIDPEWDWEVTHWTGNARA